MSADRTFDELNKLLELRSQEHIELLVEEVRKKEILLIYHYSSSSLGNFTKGLLEELRTANYNDLEDMVYRMQPTYDEILEK